MNLAPFGR